MLDTRLAAQKHSGHLVSVLACTDKSVPCMAGSTSTMSSVRGASLCNPPRKLFVPLPSCYRALVSREPQAVLLETSRFDEENHHSYIFVRPVHVVSINSISQVPMLFERIQRYVEDGLFVAGFMAYECGYHFEVVGRGDPALSVLPLAWFGVYETPFLFDHKTGRFEGTVPDKFLTRAVEAAHPDSFAVHGCRLGISEDEYCSKIGSIKDCILRGETYQVNFTDKLLFDFTGSPAALFTALSKRQKVSYGALINLGDSCILSLSPELFFRMNNRRIVTRPMKGTARRGKRPTEDRQITRWLRNDPKNRAENVMIVDLLRNDLGRISEFGSVSVDSLCSVEKYQTLFQMTSTVSGTVKQGLRFYDIFQSLFPSGSVTGAPKIRTMQIIRQLERTARGVYTGAIGFFSPKGEAAFNVAIRTIVLHGGRGEMGVGSGVTFDSLPQEEYAECRLKAEFLVGA